MAHSHGKNDQARALLEGETVSTDPQIIRCSTEQSDHIRSLEVGPTAPVKTSELATRPAVALHSLPAMTQAVDASTFGTDSAKKDLSAPDALAIEDRLIATIEGEVIPRLLLAYGQMAREDEAFDAFLTDAVDEPSSGDTIAAADLSNSGSPSRALLSSGLKVEPSDVAEFTRILIAHDAPVAIGFIDMQLARGVSVADLLLDLCAPAARELGAMWMRDECSFGDVTIGLSSLELVILRCGGPEKNSPGITDQNRSVLLGAMPGNQHIFGLLIVKELFRRSGWVVRAPKANTSQALLDSVRSTYFSIVGLSVGADEDLPACQALVKDIRRVSCNANLLVIVGGHGIQRVNQGTCSLDVDLIARDGREGLHQIERMVNRLEPSLPMN